MHCCFLGTGDRFIANVKTNPRACRPPRATTRLAARVRSRRDTCPPSSCQSPHPRAHRARRLSGPSKRAASRAASRASRPRRRRRAMRFRADDEIEETPRRRACASSSRARTSSRPRARTTRSPRRSSSARGSKPGSCPASASPRRAWRCPTRDSSRTARCRTSGGRCAKARSTISHWSPYDTVGVVNADP